VKKIIWGIYGSISRQFSGISNFGMRKLLSIVFFLCSSICYAEETIVYRPIVKILPPLTAHILTIPLPLVNMRFTVSVGQYLKGKNTVPEMVEKFAGGDWFPLAAINGDYFEYKTEPLFWGTLQGLCIIERELVSGPAGEASFCVNKEGRPFIRDFHAKFEIVWPDGSVSPFGLNCSTTDYKSEVRTAEIVLFTPLFENRTGTRDVVEITLKKPVGSQKWLPLVANETYEAETAVISKDGNSPIPSDGMVISISQNAKLKIPEVKNGDIIRIKTTFLESDITNITTAVSGGPLLLKNGELKIHKPLDVSTALKERAPRTVIGINSTNVFMVVVDGRQVTSVGMNHYELATFMKELGCVDALNFDGGGSSILWYNGKIVNSPSEYPLRAVGNTLILLHNASN